MNNKIGAILITALLSTVVVMVVGFAYLQSEINNLKPIATPIPSSTSSIHPPSPTSTRNIEATPTPGSIHSSVTYSWYLKPRIMDNETWLQSTLMGRYNNASSWRENYVTYLTDIWEIPQGIKDSGISGIAGVAAIFHLPVTVSYIDSTGYTQVTYEYKDDTYYVIESGLSSIAVNGDWTKQYT